MNIYLAMALVISIGLLAYQTLQVKRLKSSRNNIIRVNKIMQKKLLISEERPF
jgi:hypothetical protein